MIYLLDTVALIRHFLNSKNIDESAKRILDFEENHYFHISIISLMEVMYLSEKRRILIDLDQTLEEIYKRSNFEIIDLNDEIIKTAKNIKFPDIHDRLILATAKYQGIPVISSDSKFSEVAGINVIWK